MTNSTRCLTSPRRTVSPRPFAESRLHSSIVKVLNARDSQTYEITQHFLGGFGRPGKRGSVPALRCRVKFSLRGPGEQVAGASVATGFALALASPPSADALWDTDAYVHVTPAQSGRLTPRPSMGAVKPTHHSPHGGRLSVVAVQRMHDNRPNPHADPAVPPQRERRPTKARATVTSSAYCRSAPAGSP